MSNKKRLAILAMAAFTNLVGTARGGYTVKTLASFDASNGEEPGCLILSGYTLYGTTYDGGASDDGTVFSVPVTGGSPTLLASFNGSNGANPDGLILSGNTLYGTTSLGGANNDGTVFSIPVTGGYPALLASFNGSNGERPEFGLIHSGNTLYGTTGYGGTGYHGDFTGGGTVFSLPVTGGSPTLLATFNGSNGETPSNVILSGNNLYGATYAGGAKNLGTVFSVPLTGGLPAVLASFNGSNGEYASGGVTLSADGNTLYGATSEGGTYNDGTVFSIPVTGGSPTLLASFNGSSTLAGLTLSADGSTLYGTEFDGGTNIDGAVFSVPVTGGSPTLLASLNRSNGENLDTGLILSADGNILYGTADSGGDNNDGTVFSLTPSPLTIAAGHTYHFPASTTSFLLQTSIGGLIIHSNGVGIVDASSSHSNRQVLVITSSTGLSLDGSIGNWTGKLDLNNNNMDLSTGSLAIVTDQIRQGYANGTWNGSGGIMSTTAANDSQHLTALGVIQNNQSGTALFTITNPFDGLTPGAGDILVKYTYYGDANLDGKVDGSDYTRIDAGYLSHGSQTGWFNGDFNYDGVIDGSDYTLIDNAFNTQGVSLKAMIFPTATIDAGQSLSVPEPTSLGVLTIGTLALLRLPCRLR